MPAVPGEAPEPDDSTPKLCPATIDGSPDKRCCLRIGHAELRRWRSSDGSQTFAWG